MLKQFEHIIFMVEIVHIGSTFNVIEEFKMIEILNGSLSVKVAYKCFLSP